MATRLLGFRVRGVCCFYFRWHGVLIVLLITLVRCVLVVFMGLKKESNEVSIFGLL